MSRAPNRFLVLAVVLAAVSGCVEPRDLKASVSNLTPEDVTVRITLEDAGEGGSEVYNRTFRVAAHDETPLPEFPPAEGAYVVRVVVEDGPRTVDALEWSRETGPDEYRVRVHADRVEIEAITL